MSRETELAWAAGFFDGEGCIQISVTRKNGIPIYHGLSVRLANVDLPSVQRFCSIMSRGSINVRTRPFQKTIYTWALGGKSVIQILCLLMPYLRAKRPEARVVFKFSELRSSVKRVGTILREELDDIYWELRLLKHQQRQVPYTGDRYDTDLQLRNRPTDHAWLAGLIDAEGCIAMYDNSLSLVVTMMNADTIAFLAALRPEGKVRTQNRKNDYVCCQWRVFGQKVFNVLDDVRPHMTTRAVQADAVLENRHLFGLKGSLSAEVRLARAHLIAELKHLKRISGRIIFPAKRLNFSQVSP